MTTTVDAKGTYSLASFELESTDGRRSSWGQNTRGLLVYTADGHVSVAINKDVVRDESQHEAENILDSLLFYAGTYQVEGNVIRHQVTLASNPARVGKEMIRYAELNGDSLTLTTPKESFGRAILVWKKIG